MENKINYSVQQGNAGELILTSNGAMAVCPYKSPFYMVQPNQNRIGLNGQQPAMQLTQIPCSTVCPLADFKTDDEGGIYTVDCGHKTKEFRIELAKRKPEQPKQEEGQKTADEAEPKAEKEGKETHNQHHQAKIIKIQKPESDQQ